MLLVGFISPNYAQSVNMPVPFHTLSEFLNNKFVEELVDTAGVPSSKSVSALHLQLTTKRPLHTALFVNDPAMRWAYLFLWCGEGLAPPAPTNLLQPLKIPMIPLRKYFFD